MISPEDAMTIGRCRVCREERLHEGWGDEREIAGEHENGVGARRHSSAARSPPQRACVRHGVARTGDAVMPYTGRPPLRQQQHRSRHSGASGCSAPAAWIPPSRINALSVPMRRLRPPARTAPLIDGDALTDGLSNLPSSSSLARRSGAAWRRCRHLEFRQ